MRWLPALTEDPVGSWGQQNKLDNLVWKVIPEKEKRLLIQLERRKEQRTTAGLTYVMQTSSNQNH